MLESFRRLCSAFVHFPVFTHFQTCLQMRFRVRPSFNVHHLTDHSSSLCIPIFPQYTRLYKCRRQVAVLRLMSSFFPPGVSGDADARGAVVLQWLQGREETPLQTNCLGQTGQLQVCMEHKLKIAVACAVVIWWYGYMWTRCLMMKQTVVQQTSVTCVERFCLKSTRFIALCCWYSTYAQ